MDTPRPVDVLLSNIQRTLKAPKNQYNSFGKYKYRAKEDIQEAVKALLPEGAYIYIVDSLELIGERYYVKAKSALSYHGAEISSEAYAREPLDKKGMDTSQITGAVSSYAGKYSLGNLFALDDTKDSDHSNQTPSEKPNNREIYQGNDEDKNWLKETCRKLGVTDVALQKQIHVKMLESHSTKDPKVIAKLID